MGYRSKQLVLYKYHVDKTVPLYDYVGIFWEEVIEVDITNNN